MTLHLSLHEKYRLWLDHFELSPGITDMLYKLSVVLFMVVASYLAFRFAKWLARKVAVFYSNKSRTRLVEILDNHRFFSYLCYQLPLLIIKNNLSLILPEGSGILRLVQSVYELGVVGLFLILIFSLLNSFVELYQYKEKNRSKPIKGLVQFLQLLIGFFGVVVCVAIIFNLSKSTVLAGLGALSAILMLVFKDSITGLVAGVQLSFNKMVEIGDWISLSKYDVDGEVIDITITSVKVRNWDKSVSSVPSYNLVISDSVKNWKTMTRSGCRRMVRYINLDVLMVRSCSPEMLEKYRALPGVAQALDAEEPTVGRLTNLGVFRTYLYAYLRSHEKVNKRNEVLISQMQATQYGLPLEITCFINAPSTLAFQNTQSEIMEHILTVLPGFDLYLFQSKGDDKGLLTQDD